MGLRKLSRTERVALTISSKLYSEITEYITNSMKFSNYPDFASFAVQYFAQQFIRDIAPHVSEELQKRKETNTHLEKLEFESEYTGEKTTTQATMAVGAVFQLNTFHTMFNQLDADNMLVYAIEYTFKSMILRDSAITKCLLNKTNEIADIKPTVKFKELKK